MKNTVLAPSFPRAAIYQVIALARVEASRCADPCYDAALVERTVAFFHEVLVKLSREAYFTHPHFAIGVQVARAIYVKCFEEYGPLTLVELLDELEPLVSRLTHALDSSFDVHLGLPVYDYPHNIGYIVGFCSAMIQTGAVPALPSVVLLRLFPVLHQLMSCIFEVL